MPHTKPFPVSMLSPALTAVLVASANTFLANFLHPGWARISPMFIDNWLYWGSGEAFEYTREHFSDTYYFRRWTITGPYLLMNQMGIHGGLSHSVLAAASFALLSFAIFLFLFEMTGSRPKATLGLLISTINPATILMIGNGYHPAALLFFLVVSLVLVAKTVRDNRMALWIAAGFSWGLAVVSYQIAVFFLPLVLSPLIYKWVTGPRGLISLQSHFRNLWYFFTGFLLLVAVDLLIGLVSRSNWADLVSYSFLAGVGLQSSGDWGIDPSGFARALIDSGYSILPALIGCVIVIWGYSSFKRFHINSIFLPGLLMTILAYFANSFMGSNPLFVSQTVTPLVVVSAIVLSGFFLTFESHTARVSAIGAAAALVGLAIMNTYWLALIDRTTASWITVGLVFVIVACNWGVRKTRKCRKKLSAADRIMSSAALFALTFMYLVQSSSVAAGQAYSNPVGYATFSSLIEQLEEEISEVNEIAAAVDGRIWILDNRSWPGWSPLVSSFYGLYSALSVESSPQQLDCNQVSWVLTTRNPTIVVVGEQEIRTSENSLTELLGECGNTHLVERVDLTSAKMSVYSVVSQ